MKKAFEHIYEKSIWGNGSGPGSNPKHCVSYLHFLDSLIKPGMIVLDVGCGDCFIYNGFDWSDRKYTGIDIVETAIRSAETRHHHQCKFIVGDALDGKFLWNQDIVIIKDVLQHLPYKECRKIARKCKNAPFEILEELLLVKGMTREIFEKVKEDVTVFGEGKININTVGKRVLYGLGLEEDCAKKVLSYREGTDGEEGTEDPVRDGNAAQESRILHQQNNKML